jgi:acyl-coenzyme A thioesterase PaaI-like protein
MQNFEPIDPDFETRARYGFSLQNLMTTINAKMTKVARGEVHIELPFNTKLTQQHGYIQVLSRWPRD